MLTGTDIYALLPLIIIGGSAVVIMIIAAFKRNHLLTNILSLASLAAAFASLFEVSSLAPRQVSPMLIVDGFSLFFLGLIFCASFIVVIISYSYFEKQDENREEYYVLTLLATLGASVLVLSTHFISIFLGLEVLSVSLYVLIAYLRKQDFAIEAGVKYLVLAAASSAFLLFGMALVYAKTGTMEFSGIGQNLNLIDISLLSITGFAMIIVGVGFKLAVVPFHMWTPDVYEGAPAPVTAFIATVSKGGMFALLFRFFIEVGGYEFESILLIFSIIAIASMLVGNLLALFQKNVKRILAYSSIAHLGYMLVAFIAGGERGIEAATFYLVAYFVTTLGTFGIVTVLSTKEREADSIDDYKGLFWKKPWTAAIFSAMLLSLAGIPLTAGFVGKFFLVASGVNSSLWLLAIVLVVSSVIGLYYYLRIITAMFTAEEKEDEPVHLSAYSFSGGVAMAVVTILLIYFGVYPTGLVQVIKSLTLTVF